MPVHDWSKVVTGTFHDFHQGWIIEIRNALIQGVLPGGFYAVAEQVSSGPISDVATLESDHDDQGNGWDFGNCSTVMTVAAIRRAFGFVNNPRSTSTRPKRIESSFATQMAIGWQ